MPRAPTISPATRRLAPNPPTGGPSWTRRTSWTRPALRPSWSMTSAPSRSVRRIAGSGQVADDVVTGPGLQPIGLQLRLWRAELDRAPDPLDDREGDPGRAPVLAVAKAVGDGLHPGAEAATEAAAERGGADEDRGHPRRPATVGDGQLPALVRIISGIVATATTSSRTRYSDPRALVNHEFTLSPM